MVKDFHIKFKQVVNDKPVMTPKDIQDNRSDLIEEEVVEYYISEEICNTAKELGDILYTVYGAIIEHGLQDVMEDVFEEIHKSNMSKDYAKYKMVKGESYFKADIEKLLKDK